MRLEEGMEMPSSPRVGGPRSARAAGRASCRRHAPPGECGNFTLPNMTILGIVLEVYDGDPRC